MRTRMRRNHGILVSFVPLSILEPIEQTPSFELQISDMPWIGPDLERPVVCVCMLPMPVIELLSPGSCLMTPETTLA